ncbi:lantibiotic dehydratase [Streptomyces noboritoensis]|uniref:Lantibiotic dehydratase n=1 Tax=Streptomyces noboritoensis TaxID=67337 RepID=A0ABV6TD93_9ACTN
MWPDAEWAARVADARLTDPRTRATVRVMANGLVVERGARLVLPSTRIPGEGGTELGTGEITIARSKLTDHLLRTARTPISIDELVDGAARRFPQAPRVPSTVPSTPWWPRVSCCATAARASTTPATTCASWLRSRPRACGLMPMRRWGRDAGRGGPLCARWTPSHPREPVGPSMSSWPWTRR